MDSSIFSAHLVVLMVERKEGERNGFDYYFQLSLSLKLSLSYNLKHNVARKIIPDIAVSKDKQV